MNKQLIFVAVIAVALGSAFANCPASCSGHGTCGANDKCKCYPNFKGLDCSERVCPFRIAFADVASGNNQAHNYLECSGKGICDRKSGTCKCFAGYEGQACRRTTCPNLCSGHGTCELMDEIAADASAAAGGAADRVYNLWDAKKHQVCKCDAYWHGVDCSERSCPKGDDPLTLSQVADVETFALEATTANQLLKSGHFTLTYKDTFNGVWTTRPIPAPYDKHATAKPKTAQAAAMDVQLALEALPNQVVSGAKVTCTYTAAASGVKQKWVYVVTFDKSNSGNQASRLTLNTAGCEIAGCQPYWSPLKDDASPTPAVVTPTAVSQTTAGTTEHATCSNRGACDEATGLCQCHSGYYGEACEMQTALF